jgi:hypothetical protein
MPWKMSAQSRVCLAKGPHLCITRWKLVTEYGAGDEGESVYGENADFKSGLGICE